VLNPIKKAVGLGDCVILMYGAAPLKQSTVDYFLSLGLPIMNMYGMTETSSCATCHSKYKTSMNAAGFALPGTDVKIANPDENGEGEIRMLGRNTMMGYFKNEEACRSTFDEDGYVMSGDLGTIDEHGWVRITGRIKELIITAGGENIAPVFIEDTFKRECPPCSNIMVVGDHQRFISALITFVVDVDFTNG
jgi:long-chain-fatty-acid--CoA ligase ACSBG